MVRRTPLLPPRAQRVQTDTSLAIVNVVLLLLLFFLASGSLISAQDTDIDLPTTQELLPEQLPSPLLEVRLDGGLLLDGESVTLTQLDDMLEGGQTLYVLMERTAPALDLLELLAQPPPLGRSMSHWSQSTSRQTREHPPLWPIRHAQLAACR